MTQSALHALRALALTSEIRTGVLPYGDLPHEVLPHTCVPVGDLVAGQAAVAGNVASVPDREQMRKRVHNLAASALLACALCAATAGVVASAEAAVAVTPLSEEVFETPINNVTLPADKRPGSGQDGPLIPLEEWKRYCNRPNALGSHLLGQVVAEYPHGATGYVRDPAYLPVLPMTPASPAKTRSKKSSSAGAVNPAYPAVVPVPTVSAPTVPAPTAPSVASPTVMAPAAPAGVKVPTNPATRPVAAPYSATAPATGPIESPANPASPAVPSASPSLAAQSPAQDGLMVTGRGIASDMASGMAKAATNVSGAAGATNSGTAAEAGAQLNLGERRPFIAGQANTLVVPPEGISLQPNNGAAALTAPANPQ